MGLDQLKRDIIQMIYLSNQLGMYSYEDMYNSIYTNDVNEERHILIKNKVEELTKELNELKEKWL